MRLASARHTWGPHAVVSGGHCVLDAVFAAAVETPIWFRLRPVLNDPKDELYVECAFASGADVIITDDRHFRHPALREFGIRTLRADQFAGSLQQGG